MITAIYVRKSTDQSGVSDDQRSVARQLEHAKAYAARKGWSVADDLVYVDDGISGAEFSNRPGFLRLMNALKPRPPFQVLVMSEESRLGRESIETGFALKQLIQAGVRVFFYLEDRERTLDSPIEKIMMQLTGFADEVEREKARQRTYDAMQRKARAGHVTGGRLFGYNNVEVLGGAGQRSHVERRVNEAEAAIVRQIFALCAEGYGVKAEACWPLVVQVGFIADAHTRRSDQYPAYAGRPGSKPTFACRLRRRSLVPRLDFSHSRPSPAAGESDTHTGRVSLSDATDLARGGS